MKKPHTPSKRLIAMFLIFTILFSLFPNMTQVEAASVISIKYERTRQYTLSGPKDSNRLIIYGSGFVNPKVKAGQVSEYLMPINTSQSNEFQIVIDDPTALEDIEGIPNTIMVLNNGTTPVDADGTEFNLSVIPTITNASTDKVYIGDPLEIAGYFDGLDPDTDTISISRTEYKLEEPTTPQDPTTEAILTDNKIIVPKAKSPTKTGVSDIVITRNLGGPSFQVITKLESSITVVDKLIGVAVDRVDPNSGTMDVKNMINIYGTSGNSQFNDKMRIFINSSEGSEGVNKGVIKDSTGKIIGLSVELPTYNKAGAVNLVLTNPDKSSEYVITNGFIYLNIGNPLTIEPDGISPTFKKETEYKPITIIGRNIGYFDSTKYDNLSNVTLPADGIKGYVAYPGVPDANNTTSYKVEYQGKYFSAENGTEDVTIIRQINVFIDGDAKIEGTPTFALAKDIIVVNAANVNLDPNQPKQVDVTIKTSTIIYKPGATPTIYYSRKEEYTKPKSFMYIPNEVTPQITAITPNAGPYDKDLLVTITGFNFQVLEDGRTPQVTIGDRVISGKDSNGIDKVKVFDSENRPVDGKKIQLGTKISFILPAGAEMVGAVDVVVRNPSEGQYPVNNGFTFKKPPTGRPIPKIFSVKEAFADMRGGIITGETILITGENFDPALENDHRVFITIGGQKAEIKGKVSADGKSVTVIPPPGIVEGPTQIQLINSDGSMATANFEYRRAVTSPKITKIVPTKGGKGTKLVIKGEDFLLPDGGVNPDDPRRKGTVVLLNGKELNAYNYKYDAVLDFYSITDPTDNPDRGIYYYGNFDPDGDAGTPNSYLLNGKMVTVVDNNTIYVDIPDRFYSLNMNKVAPYLKSEAIPMGNLSVEVLNPDGAKSREKMTFTYLKPGTTPVIDSISPSSGSIDGGTVVTILGSGFRPDDIKVYFGSEQATKVDFINNTELRVQVPIYPYTIPQGKDSIDVPVMVMNYDGAMAVAEGEDGFTYRIPGSRPVITSLSPAKGSAAGNEQVIIRGRDFRRLGDNSGHPKVYFNGIPVPDEEVQWITTGDVGEILVVTTPPSKVGGPVDVVIVNHDSGSYTFKSFTYEVSKPTITSITPNSMGKMGGTKIQINGTGYKKGDLKKLLALPDVASLPAGSDPNFLSEQVGRNTTPKDAASVIDNLVIFGDVTTGDKKAIDTVVGPFTTDLHDLRVIYEANGPASAVISIVKTSDPDTIIRQLNIPVGSKHLFILNGAQDLGDDSIGDEGILVEVTPNQVIATRRIAPIARWENNGLQITAIAPAVASINTRSVYVQNADGGTASSTINVLNPASEPTITYISPRNMVKRDGEIVAYTSESNDDQEYYTYTPLNGGAFLTINGTDFRRNVKVYLDNKLLEIVSRSVNDNQLVVKIPKGIETDLDKLYRIMVVNEDGGSADSSILDKPHYVVYKIPQSNPIIENVIPANTSARGENTIRIIGADFRDEAKVFIDGIECEAVTFISYKELTARVPLGLTAGKKVVQVMNKDYGFGEKKDALTIISAPRIDTVYDATKNKEIKPVVFSVDGGQKIRLNGVDFVDGARVVIGGTLKTKEELKAGESGIPGYNIHDAEMVLVGGVEGTAVKVENSTILTFTTPKYKLGDVDIYVINKDGGISNKISGSYQKPKPDSPTGLYVEVVDSDTIKLEWDAIPETKHYELYAAVSATSTGNTNYVYLGSVAPYELGSGRLRYYVDGLKASTYYSFKLKSVNNYGPSTFSPATAFVKTKDTKITDYYYVVGDFVLGVAQNDKIDISGKAVVFTAGEKSLGNYGSGMVVHFNQAAYRNLNPKTVDIGLQILKKYPNNNITINDNSFTMRMLSSNLLVKETSAVSSAKLSDSKMAIIINKDLKAKADEIKLRVPKGYKAVASPFSISVNMQVETGKTSIKNLNGFADLSFAIASDVKKLYPGGVYIAYYNNTTKKLEIVGSSNSTNVISVKTNRPGEYVMLGKLKK